jgi:hypothetical protein
MVGTGQREAELCHSGSEPGGIFLKPTAQGIPLFDQVEHLERCAAIAGISVLEKR